MSDFDEEKYSRIFTKEIDHSEVRYGLLIVTEFARFLQNRGLITIIDKKDNTEYFGTRDTTVDYGTPRIYSTEEHENNIREFVKKYINIPGIDVKSLSISKLKETITEDVFKKYIKGDKFLFQFDLQDNTKIYIEYVKNTDCTIQSDIMKGFGIEQDGDMEMNVELVGKNDVLEKRRQKSASQDSTQEEIVTKEDVRLHEENGKNSMNNESYVYKNIKRFIFLGNIHNIKSGSCAELMAEVAGIMYDKHKDDEFEKKMSQIPNFKKSRGACMQPKQIRDTDFYIETKSNNDASISICYRMIKLFGYTDKDLIIETVKPQTDKSAVKKPQTDKSPVEIDKQHEELTDKQHEEILQIVDIDKQSVEQPTEIDEQHVESQKYIDTDRDEPMENDNDISNVVRRVLKGCSEDHICRTEQKVKDDLHNMISVASITAKEEIDIEKAGDITEIELYRYLSDALLYKEGFMLPVEHVINEILCWKIGLIIRQIPADLGHPGKGKTDKRRKISKIVCENHELEYKDVVIERGWDDSSYLIGAYNIASDRWDSREVLDMMTHSLQDNKFSIINLDDFDRSSPEGYFAKFMTFYSKETRILSLRGYLKPGEYCQMQIPPPKFIFVATANGPRYGDGIDLTDRMLDRMICVEPYLEYNESELEILLAKENVIQIPDLKIPFKNYIIDYQLEDKDFLNFKTKMTVVQNIKLLLIEIDKLLKIFGIEKSERTYETIMLYIYLAHKLDYLEFTIYAALDTIVKQKYLPKIRGARSAKKTLETLKNFLAKQEKPYEFNRTVDKINRMINNGYDHTDYF